MLESLNLQGILDTADTVLFRIGDSPVTLGVLLRTVLSVVALFWVASWLRRWLATRALKRFHHLDLGTREALASALRYAVLGLGLALILQNAVILAFGGGYKMFEGGWIEPVQFFGIGMAQQRIVLIVVAVAVFAGLEWMVRKTRMGKSIRAVSQNIECCQVNGIDVESVVRRTFLLGTALAALSGILTAPVNVSVYGGMGESITLKTFAVIVMGGMGNVRGTLLAGVLLGVVESLVSGLIGLQYRDAVGFVALLLMLMLWLWLWC